MYKTVNVLLLFKNFQSYLFYLFFPPLHKKDGYLASCQISFRFIVNWESEPRDCIINVWYRKYEATDRDSSSMCHFAQFCTERNCARHVLINRHRLFYFIFFFLSIQRVNESIEDNRYPGSARGRGRRSWGRFDGRSRAVSPCLKLINRDN